MPGGDSLRRHRAIKALSGPAAPAPNASRTIRQVAEEFGVTLRTLRFYEIKGLLKPNRTASLGKLDRIYSEDDRSRVRAILQAARFGFSLTEIREFIEKAGGRKAKPDFDLPVDAVRRQTEHLRYQHAKLGEALAEVEDYLASKAPPHN